MPKKFTKKLFFFFCLFGLSVTMMGCPQSTGPLIDLSQVDEAFRNSRGTSLPAWVQDFEWRVNQIYLGREFVSVDSRRYMGKLRFIGFVERNRVPGYQIGADRKLFTIKETTPFMASSSFFHYKVVDRHGWVYKSHGSMARAANAMFFTWWFMPRYSTYYYYTPRTRIVVLRRRRLTYRKSALYRSRRARYKRYAKRTASRRRSFRRSRSRSRSRSRRSFGRSRRSSGGKW